MRWRARKAMQRAIWLHLMKRPRVGDLMQVSKMRKRVFTFCRRNRPRVKHLQFTLQFITKSQEVKSLLSILRFERRLRVSNHLFILPPMTNRSKVRDRLFMLQSRSNRWKVSVHRSIPQFKTNRSKASDHLFILQSEMMMWRANIVRRLNSSWRKVLANHQGREASRKIYLSLR